MNFKDWANPTPDELTDWAYEPNSFAPEQDFNLICAHDVYIELVLKFASDSKCPSKLFFLQCLYIYIGDKVRNKLGIKQGFLEKAKNIEDDQIQKWLQRSLELIKNPSLFNYSDWCDAELALK